MVNVSFGSHMLEQLLIIKIKVLHMLVSIWVKFENRMVSEKRKVGDDVFPSNVVQIHGLSTREGF